MKQYDKTFFFCFIFLIIIVFLIAVVYDVRVINFTAREFCILKGKEQNKTVDNVVGYDSSCFHPFDREISINQCRIKCIFSD